MQSKAFKKSIRNAPLTYPLSRHWRIAVWYNFSENCIATRVFYQSIYILNLQIYLSQVFNELRRMLTGNSFQNCSIIILKNGHYNHIFNSWGERQLNKELLWNSQKWSSQIYSFLDKHFYYLIYNSAVILFLLTEWKKKDSCCC